MLLDDFNVFDTELDIEYSLNFHPTMCIVTPGWFLSDNNGDFKLIQV